MILAVLLLELMLRKSAAQASYCQELEADNIWYHHHHHLLILLLLLLLLLGPYYRAPKNRGLIDTKVNI